MHYVYILQSLIDNKFYVGYTQYLKRRIEKHNSGQVPATKGRNPLKLVYYEACLNTDDAITREKIFEN
jgi:putative endonuclease